MLFARVLLTAPDVAGYLEQTDHDPPSYLPAKAIETIGLLDLVNAVRRAEESSFLRNEGLLSAEPVDNLFDRLRDVVVRELAAVSLREMVLSGAAPPNPGADPAEADGA